MVSLRSLVLSTCLLGCLTSALDACLWDSDTLEQERSRYPTALELITGKFLRHTREFYEWRIRDRLRRLTDDPNNPALADDLAVACDKTEQDDKAIAVMLDVEKKTPGRYETAANLGTFYIHSGRYEDGLKQIERAIKINPNAHFGREVYQKFLVEYLLECRVAGKVPVPLSTAPDVNGARGFALYLWRRKHDPQSAVGFLNVDNQQNFNTEMDRAVKGILGMMRFGRHDSPLLLEAVGDLLSASYGEATERNANWLAARAYLRASQAAKTEVARKAFRTLAQRVLESQGSNTDHAAKLKDVEGQLKQEVADADRWYQQVRQDELAWIADGRNVDAAFTQKYYSEPKVVELDKRNQAALAAATDSFQRSGEPSGAFWEAVTNTGGPWWLTCLMAAVFVLVLIRLRRPTARSVGETGGAEQIRSEHGT